MPFEPVTWTDCVSEPLPSAIVLPPMKLAVVFEAPVICGTSVFARSPPNVTV